MRSPTVSAHASVLRALRSAFAAVALLVIAAPSAFGPATTCALGRWGADLVHVCKCGMTPGRCGCRECERLEHERLHGHGPVPAISGDCDHETPLASAGVPAAVLPAVGVLAASVPAVQRHPFVKLEATRSRPGEGPPDPPPRRA